MKLNKNELTAAIITASITAAVLAVLLLCGWSALIPDGEEGLTVNFGNVDWSEGDFETLEGIDEPQPENTEPQLPDYSTTENPGQEDLITQDDESVALEAARKKAEEEARRQAEEAQRKKLEEERALAENINHQAQNLFGKTNNSSQNQGTGDQPNGNQGKTEGNTESRNPTGGGIGNNSFSLEGRSLGSGGLIEPLYTAQADGTVVVRILVDSRGNVVSAIFEPKGSSNADNQALRDAAITAAKKTKFNAIEGNQNQAGTITYHFRLK